MDEETYVCSSHLRLALLDEALGVLAKTITERSLSNPGLDYRLSLENPHSWSSAQLKYIEEERKKIQACLQAIQKEWGKKSTSPGY